MTCPERPDPLPVPAWRRILLVADIEGSSLCHDRAGSSFLTRAWSRACAGMTCDVAAVVTALFDAGAEQILVKDFHRTGWNLFSEKLDPRARVLQGYRRGPVPGIGDPAGAEAAMFLGMHAASGTGGFLAHTLTSRISVLEVNGRPLAEVELFSASIAPFGIRPVFFSGCPTACRGADAAIPGLQSFPIPKQGRKNLDIQAWRRGLSAAAVAALQNRAATPYRPAGPFTAVVTLREGHVEARRISRRWGFRRDGARILLDAVDMQGLYRQLIRLCYFTPLTEKALPLSLAIYNAWGWLGLHWARRSLRRSGISLDRLC